MNDPGNINIFHGLYLRHLEKQYVINGFAVDGLGKFINHGFDSNVKPIKDVSLSIPRIYFKALRNIEKGEGNIKY